MTKGRNWMIRKMFVMAAAIAIPISVVGATGGTAFAGKGPSAATDTATCHAIDGTVSFSIPLTNAGVTSGTEVTTVNAQLVGCSAAGAFPVTLTSGSVSGSFSGKPGSVKHPAATCGGLVGATKEKGTLSISWSSTPGVPPTTLKLKTATGGVASDGHASFTVQGKYKGSFGGADKGKSSVTQAETTQTTAQLAAQCGGSGISSIGLQGPVSGNAVSLM
jgi:hypothetical protein